MLVNESTIAPRIQPASSYAETTPVGVAREAQADVIELATITSPAPEPSAQPLTAGLRAPELQSFLRPVDKDMREMRYLMMTVTADRDTQQGSSQGPHTSLAADQWTAGVGQYADLSGNRGGMSLMGTTNQGSTFGVYDNIRLAGGAFIVPVGQLDGGNIDFRGDVFGGSGWGALGGTAIWKGPDGGFGAAGVAAWLEATTGVKVLGAYQGPDASLRSHYLVEWNEKLGPGAALDLGLGAHLFGIAGKLFFNGNRQVSYRSFMSAEQVRDLLNREARKGRIMRNAAVATGVAKGPVAAPKKKETVSGPKALRPGESLRTVLGGTFVLGVSVGSYGVRGGIHGTYSGETECVIERVDENTVDLKVKPKKLAALAFNVDALVLAEAYDIRTLVLALEQGFRFDIREPAARQALNQALAGKLPGTAVAPKRIKDGDKQSVASAFSEALPAGVQRTFVAKDDMPSTRRGMGIPRPFFTRKIAGFLREKTNFCDRRVQASSGEASVWSRHCGSEQETQKTYWGTHRKRVSSEALQESARDEAGAWGASFEALALHADFNFDHLRGKDGLTKMATSLNKALGTTIGAFTAGGNGYDYDVALRRNLSAGDLTRLAGANPEAIEAAATASGASGSKLKALVQKLAALQAGQGVGADLAMVLSTPVQKYVGSQGLPGLGAIHRLLGGGDEALEVATNTSAISEALAAAANAILQFPTAITGASKAAKEAFDEAEKRLGAALMAANDNQVLRSFEPQAFEQSLQGLLELRTQMRDHRDAVLHGTR